jgi:RNA polymerase sigma factor (sigma-70 family)
LKTGPDWNQLLARCLDSNDGQARREFVAAAYAIVARIMAARANAIDAEDLTQGVFVKLFEDDGRRLRAFDVSLAVPFPVYLRVIAIRHAIDWTRSRGHRAALRQVDLEEVAKTIGLDPDADRRLMIRELQEAVPKLSRQQRKATQLLLEGLTVQEIARCIGLSEGGAAALLWRARKHLRELMGVDR